VHIRCGCRGNGGRGRGAALAEIERRLNSLNIAMLDDIEAAEREVKL